MKSFLRYPSFGLYIFPCLLVLAVMGMVFFVGANAKKLGTAPGLTQELAITYTSDEQRAIQAIEKVQPSVVTIILFEQVTQPVVRFDAATQSFVKEERSIRREAGTGTGFFVNSRGFVLTNKHVISNTKASIVVVTRDHLTYDARVVAKDPLNDIAILKVGGGPFPAVAFADTDKTPLGSFVIAIGNALGRFQQSVTQGILSGRGRSVTASDDGGKSVQLDDVLQTDAAINPGNSGGPLVTLEGTVLGMNAAMERGEQSIAFAIPAYELKRAVESFFKRGKIVRPYLGVRYQMITSEVVAIQQLPVGNGAFLVAAKGEAAVVPGGPGDTAGLKAADVIVAVDGKLIDDDRSLAQIIRSREPGDTMMLDVVRGSERLRLKAVLGEINGE